MKADQTKSGNITANDGFPCPSAAYRNQTTTLDEEMQDLCNDKPDLNRLKPEAKNLNSNGNLGNKNADVIELDADDSACGNEHKTRFSAQPFGTDDSTLDSQNKSTDCQNYNRQSTTSECTTIHVAKEASFFKYRVATGKSTSLENLRAKLHIPQDSLFERSTNVTTSTWEKETLTINGISKQATRLASGNGPQQIHNFNSLSGESICSSK